MQLLIDFLLTTIFPRYCLLCKKSGLSHELLCQSCLRDLPFYHGNQCQHCAILLPHSAANYCGHCLKHAPAFDHTLALFSYTDPITHFITGLKFNQQLVYAELIGILFAEKIKSDPKRVLPECLVPVPLHKSRLRERGYNQALCIAKTIGQQLTIPILTEIITRHKSTTPQSSLQLKERSRNVKNAFTVNQIIPYQHIAVIDDVMTTGQTVQEIARCFKQRGVSRVEVWCAARA